MTEIDRRINELCSAIAKENNPVAMLKLAEELNHTLAQTFGDVPAPSDSASNAAA
jgi:hypothetical protein